LARYDYDIIYIGGGVAGFAGSTMANGLGKKVAIVEKDKLAGNCTWNTCVPTKALLEAASIAKSFRNYQSYGLTTAEHIDICRDGVMVYVREVVKRAYETDAPESFQSIGIDIIRGHAEFLDHHHIRVNDRELSAKNFVIATGSAPLIPQIEGLAKVPFYTNENFQSLEPLPKSMIVLGGGPAGVEFS
jgi:pyruvate/2-oxoglutarate dehydrogenase complex dihydrolipoamide dehydrogenase (E3) component